MNREEMHRHMLESIQTLNIQLFEEFKKKYEDFDSSIFSLELIGVLLEQSMHHFATFMHFSKHPEKLREDLMADINDILDEKLNSFSEFLDEHGPKH